MTTGLPVCADCKHFNSDDMTGNFCDAFPDGIPDDIFLCIIDHKEPYEGDGGIQYEPVASGED